MTRRAKMVTGVGLGAALAVAGLGALLVNRSVEAGDAAPAAAAVAQRDVRGNGETIVVYRSPTCGCCKAWEDHMRAAGYTVESREMMDVSPVKNDNGVPAPLRSCHTAVVEGYVFEGHVPAEDVARVLADRPEIDGLAVPGMPPGSPGMDVPGREDEPFEVFSFRDGAASEIWATRR